MSCLAGLCMFFLLLSIIVEYDDASNIVKLSIVSILNDRDDDMTHLVFSCLKLNAIALTLHFYLWLSPSLLFDFSFTLTFSPFRPLPGISSVRIPYALPSCHFIWIMHKAIWLWLVYSLWPRTSFVVGRLYSIAHNFFLFVLRSICLRLLLHPIRMCCTYIWMCKQ